VLGAHVQVPKRGKFNGLKSLDSALRSQGDRLQRSGRARASVARRSGTSRDHPFRGSLSRPACMRERPDLRMYGADCGARPAEEGAAALRH